MSLAPDRGVERGDQHGVDHADIRPEHVVRGKEICRKDRRTGDMLRNESAFILGPAGRTRVPLRCGRDGVKNPAIRGNRLGETVVRQHMNLMTDAPQLAEQGALRRHVAAAVPERHQDAQRTAGRNA